MVFRALKYVLFRHQSPLKNYQKSRTKVEVKS
jgi:hypothetical protein